MKIFLSIGLGIITGLLWIYWLMLPAEANEEVKEEVKQKEVSIVHNWRPKDSIVQEYVQYAYAISNDIHFVATLDAENGRRDPTRQSQVPDKKRWMSNNWKEDSRGFCQLHRRRHKNIVDDPRFTSDWKRQMEQCYNKYKWWTKFYWYYNRHKSLWRFTITQSNAGVVPHKQAVLNYYAKAVEATKTRQTLSEQLEKAKVNEVKARGDCIENKQCQ